MAYSLTNIFAQKLLESDNNQYC